jgi:hypothetical protein
MKNALGRDCKQCGLFKTWDNFSCQKRGDYLARCKDCRNLNYQTLYRVRQSLRIKNKRKVLE